MGITVKIHNKKDKWIQMDRACFGFLSYIDNWDCDDVEDHSRDYSPEDIGYEEGLEEFEAKDLKGVTYIESMNGHNTLANTIREALEGLPQYYGDWVIEQGTDEGCWDNWEFYIPLEGKPMASTVIAGMMLRNVLCYGSMRNSYMKMVEKGVKPSIAFVLCQGYYYRHDAINKDKCGFYRGSAGDETIFKGRARICDLKAMINGEIGNDWQGVFGETANGYGRYGEYDGSNAKTNPRTKDRLDLADVTMIEKGWEESPFLHETDKLGVGFKEEGSGTNFFPIDDFVSKLIPKILEKEE